MWKRISQIWGVPLSGLKPIVSNAPTQAVGEYRPFTHTIHFDPNWKSERATNHEERHSMQGLISPQLLRNRFDAVGRKIKTRKSRMIENKQIKSWELSNPAGGVHITADNATRGKKSAYAFALIGGSVGAVYGGLAGFILGLQAGHIPLLPNYLRSRAFHTIIKNHGEDAAILFYVNPPRNQKGQVSTNFIGWEKKMVQEGYLHQTGGLTRRGLGFLKTQMTAAEIFNRLRQINKNRTK